MATINVYSLVPCNAGNIAVQVIAVWCLPPVGARYSVTYGPSSLPIASGQTDSQGRFSFSKSCGAGVYRVAVASVDLCHADTVSLLSVTNDCGDEARSIGLRVKPEYAACGEILVPRQLYIHDALGSAPNGQPNVGTRDRVFQSVRNTIAYVDVDVSGCSFSSCQSARGFVQKTEVLHGTGETAVTYNVTCSFDERGPYIEVIASWGVAAAQEITPWLNILDVACCYWTDPASGITYCNGLGCPCDGLVVGSAHLVNKPDGRTCRIIDPLVANLRNYYLYTPNGPYGNGAYTAYAIGKHYLEGDCCLSSLAIEIELEPLYCVDGFGNVLPTEWRYERDEGTATINDRGRLGLDLGCPFAPEPPGGATVLVTS